MILRIFALIFLIISVLAISVDSGFYSMMADAMGWHDGWHDDHKAISFGIKSKGMTAIIPIPLPIPIFTKEKKSKDEDKGGGDDNKMEMKGPPAGWDMPMPAGDWWM